jgi:acetyl esterase/lipase
MMTAQRWAGVIAALLILSSLLASGHTAAAGARSGAIAHRDLPYVFSARDRSTPRRQTLDLFLPSKTGERKPLLIAFVHGGFWRESDDGYGIGEALAEALVPQGVAVALIRYALAPAHKFPAQAEDIARALAYLHRVADTHGFDPKRVFLMGHSAGAHLASLVALDGRYLSDAGAPPHAVAGVIAVSGIYDLTGGPIAQRADELLAPVFGSDARTLRDASPVNHARREPPFLVLSAENDFGGFQPDARRFAARLRAAGNRDVQDIILKDFDHFSIFGHLRAPQSPVRELVLGFAGVGVPSGLLAELSRLRRIWQEPPWSTEPFWTQPQLVHAYPVDERFVAAFSNIYDRELLFELCSYPFREFHAIELRRFLDSQPREKIGSGDYLVVTNVRGERVFWRLSEIEPHQPVVVIGLDDERNLFRLSTFYRNKRAYSWKDEKTGISVRSIGAFVYFLKPPPPRFNPASTARYSLTADSFRLAETDALSAMADLPRDVHDVMYFRNSCFSCHGFRGTDVRAGHTRAVDAEPQGGYALPLESYPPKVWRQFMFEHQKSAAAIGVRPNAVTGPAAAKLFDIVEKERQRGPRLGSK